MPENRLSSTLNPSRWRFNWLLWALIFAAVTVVLTAGLTFVGFPASFSQISVPGLQAILGDVDKAWLALVWLCSAASVLLIFLVARHSSRAQWHPVLRVGFIILVGLTLLLMLRLAIERDPDLLDDTGVPTGFWPGYGLVRFLIGVLAALVALAIAFTRIASSRILLAASILVAVVVAVLPLLQTPDTGTNNSYTFDELLAPAAGRMPGFDFISQYENLLGYPLALLALIAPAWFANNPEWAAMIWITIMQVVTLVVVIVTIMRLAPRRLRWLAPITIVPITFLMGPVGLSYYATFPFRFFLPLMLLGALVFFALRQRGSITTWWIVVLLGVIAGVAATNNLDFGVPAALAGLGTLVMSSAGWRAAVRSGLLFLAGAAAVPVIYAFLGTLTGRSFHRSYFLFFVQSFGVNGFYNEPIEALDLHNTFVFVGIVGLVIGVAGLRVATLRNRVLYTAILFEAAWLLLSLPYYSGRSLVQTLITAYSLPMGILLVLLVIAAFPALQRLRRIGLRKWALGGWVTVVVTVAGLAFALASWTVFPSLPDQLARVQKPVPAAGDFPFTSPNPQKAIDRVPDGTKLIGVFGVTSAVWSIRLGVTDADVFLHPDYLIFSNGPATACTYIEGLPGDALLMTKSYIELMRADRVCTSVLDFGSVRDVYSQHADSLDPGDWVLVQRK